MRDVSGKWTPDPHGLRNNLFLPIFTFVFVAGLTIISRNKTNVSLVITLVGLLSTITFLSIGDSSFAELFISITAAGLSLSLALATFVVLANSIVAIFGSYSGAKEPPQF